MQTRRNFLRTTTGIVTTAAFGGINVKTSGIDQSQDYSVWREQQIREIIAKFIADPRSPNWSLAFIQGGKCPDICLKGRICIVDGNSSKGPLWSDLRERGASVWAIGAYCDAYTESVHPLDVTTSGGRSTLLRCIDKYADVFKRRDAVYPDDSVNILNTRLPFPEGKGGPLHVINVAGKDYLRTDLNCVAADS